MRRAKNIPSIKKILPQEQYETAKFLQKKIFPYLPANHFFLVGGTALALKLGHRRSIDFDFFSFPVNTTFDPVIEEVDRFFRKEGFYHRRDIEPIAGQMNYKINNVAVLFSVFQNNSAERENEFYNLPIHPTEKIQGFDTLHILDLAGMKAFARCQRSKLKDVIDIAEVLHHTTAMQDIIATAEKQFGYDISAKEILIACSDLTDILNNSLDEPVALLNNRDTDYYISFLKKKILEFYENKC